MEGYDLSSITAIRRHLEEAKLDTKTPGVRGEERRQLLEDRLRAHITLTSPKAQKAINKVKERPTLDTINWNSSSTLRQGKFECLL